MAYTRARNKCVVWLEERGYGEPETNRIWGNHNSPSGASSSAASFAAGTPSGFRTSDTMQIMTMRENILGISPQGSAPSVPHAQKNVFYFRSTDPETFAWDFHRTFGWWPDCDGMLWQLQKATNDAMSQMNEAMRQGPGPGIQPMLRIRARAFIGLEQEEKATSSYTIESGNKTRDE